MFGAVGVRLFAVFYTLGNVVGISRYDLLQDVSISGFCKHLNSFQYMFSYGALQSTKENVC